LHRNAVEVTGGVVVGSLKSNRNRTVVLPAFVMDAVAATCQGKGRGAGEHSWPAPLKGHPR
jgi:hypothetical protein